MKDYYSAAEAIKRLEIPRSTFYYLVDQGQIPKITLPLRKQALYPKVAIDAIAAEHGEFEDTPERLEFVIPTKEDLDQLIAIEHTIWGDVGIISPENIMARFPYNPECIHVLKHKQVNKVIGSVTMSPLADGLIEKLIHFEMDESEIQPTDYLPYNNSGSQDCYVVSIVACQDIHATAYAMALLRDTSRYLMELAERGNTIKRIYTVATTDDGERLCRKLGFEEIGVGIGPLADERKAFVLNLEEKQPLSEIVKAYQGVIKNRNRRAVRQQKRQKQENVQLSAGSDWIRSEDLPYVLALDYEVYGPDVSVDFSITRTWWKKNPYACRVLFDVNNRKDIWGVLTVLPMEQATIYSILRGEKSEHEITSDDILNYEPGNTYYGYVASAIIRPEHRSQFRKLLQGVMQFWCESYPDIEVQKLYAIGFSNEGTMLIQQLYFAPRYDLGEDAYELDMRKASYSRLIREFQECIKTKKLS